MEEDTEYLKLPVEERVVHKLWKARLHGYEEVTKLFRQLDDEKSPEFSKYLGLVKKFVIDSNAVAQEKGLEAVLAFVESYALAGKTVGEVMSGIVNKCIAAPKTKTKELAVQVTLMYVEIEKQDIVQEELIKGMEAKNPKISSACVCCMTQALREFGSKIINIKPLVKKISALLEDRDKTVREEGKAMVIEMYRWVGGALSPQLNSLKPVQLTELETEFAKVSKDRAVASRFVRSQQQRQAKMVVDGGGDTEGLADEVDGECEPQVDPYDLMDPVDILSQLPKDFYEKVEAKKWQERKETLDLLEKLLQAPKLEAGDYGDLVRALKKIISKDSNVVVVTVAGKCMAGLANGLKKRFSPYVSACIPSILEKFKEKKQTVVAALKEAIDAMYPSTTIEAMQEDVVAALDSKNPSVKSETASFLARCFTHCTPTMLNKKILKAYSTVLLKMLNDPDPTVRENAADALGTAMKVVGEKAMSPLLADVENIKLTKIKECCERAVIVAKVPSRPASAPAKIDAKGGSIAAKPVKRPVTGMAKKGLPKKPTTNSAAVTSGSKVKGPSRPVERELTPEEVDEKAAEVFAEETLSGLADSNWKTRLSAMEQFTQVVSGLERDEISAQVLLRTINKKPGLKDTNFQVQKLRLEAVKIVAEVAQPISSIAVESILPDIAVTLGDPKNGSLAGETLTVLAEATNLDSVATVVLDFAFNQKSPKVQQETLNWLATAITEFGFCVQPKALMDNIRKAVGATNPTVRNAGIALTGVLYLYMGQQLSSFFESEKPALQQLIFSEFEKHVGETPPCPIRGGASSERASPTPSDDMGAANINIQDLMPHTDVGHLITDQLISDFKDKNWKVRQEALTKVETILNDNKLISNDLGELPSALALRLVDSNGKIAACAFTICQALGLALGSQGKLHLRILFPAFLQGLGDSKATIRTAALACINTWGEQVGFKELFDGEMIADGLKTGSPQMRTELWPWLSEVLPTLPHKAVPKDELLAILPHLFTNLEDRNPEVRKNCLESITPIMVHLGYEPMVKAAEKLKPGSRGVVQVMLDKARAYLPARPAAQSKTKKAEAPNKINTNTVTRPASSKNTIVKKGVVTGKPTARRKDDEADISPLLQLNSTKNQRSIDEQKLKILKWNFTTPRDEFVELLREQMQIANVNKSLIANMFHADFKYHLKAIDALNEDLPINGAATVANLDLILKWMTLRFFDTNPSVLLKGLEYLQTVFAMLIDENYHMFENEASSFLPYLILKIGDPKDAVRNGVKSLFKQMQRVYPASKLFSYLMDGLKSKNARQRTECLEQLGSLIECFGMGVCQPTASAALREIARQISDRDNSVRNAALNCVVQAFYLEGEKVYKMVGQISDKDSSLLEERIKRAAKNRPAARVVVPPVMSRQQQQSARLSEPDVEMETQAGCSRSPSPPPPPPVTRMAVVKPRPVSGPFGLDFELLERIEGNGIDIHAPKLAEFDLNEFLNDSPCKIPSNTRIGYPTLSPPKPLQPMNRLGTCTSTEKAVDTVIKGIASPDLTQAIESMIQMDALLTTDKAPVLVNKVDSLVLACVMQLRLLNQKNTVTTPLDQLSKGYRTLLMLIMAFYKNPGLSERVGKEPLRDLVDHLLRLLVDERVEELDSGESFVKVINVVVVRIIEKSDHTTIACALIKSLHECVANGNTPPRFLELVMKCLWKVIKLLPSWESRLAFNVLLKDIHCFFKDFPSVMWKKRAAADMPLRTVKTILHTMVKLKGNRILLELDQVDNSQESELESYLVKLIKAVKQEPSHPLPPKREKRLSKNTHELLSEIFRKIGTKSETNEGLQALYDFKTSHPEADIEPFLAKSSTFFQQYIEEGMRSIELSRKTQAGDLVMSCIMKSESESDDAPKERNHPFYITHASDRSCTCYVHLEPSANTLASAECWEVGDTADPPAKRYLSQGSVDSSTFFDAVTDTDSIQVPDNGGDARGVELLAFLPTPDLPTSYFPTRGECSRLINQPSGDSEPVVETVYVNHECVASSQSIAPGPGPYEEDEGDDKDAQYYLMKLRSWQQQAGIEETNNILFEDNTQADDNRNNQCNEQQIIQPEVVPVKAAPTVSNIDLLRQRLDKVKGSSKMT